MGLGGKIVLVDESKHRALGGLVSTFESFDDPQNTRSQAQLAVD